MQRLQVSTATGEGRNLHLIRRLAQLPQWRSWGRPLRILSFGCSLGFECLDLQSVFPDAQVFGCDVNPEALAEATQRCGPGITIFESSQQAFAAHGPFDLITAFNVFCRYPTTEGKDQIAAYFSLDSFNEGLSVVDACLRPGGVLALYNTPYFFEHSVLGPRYTPAAGQAFPDNGWMAKCDPQGRRLSSVRVVRGDEVFTVPDFAKGVREGLQPWPYGDPRVSVVQQSLSEQALPGSTQVVAWCKPSAAAEVTLAAGAPQRVRDDAPIVVSFYSGDAYYHDAARQLRADCERLGLDSDIVEWPAEPGQDWLALCRRKAVFYRQQLAKHQRPILWMDVDCRLARVPEVLCGARADFAAFLRDFRYLREFDAASVSRQFHPAILYFNHTPAGLALAERIAALEAASPALAATDDYFLQEAWLAHTEPLNLLLLSPTQLSFEWPVAGEETFFFGRSGQVSQHLGQAAQHPVPLHAAERRKSVLMREAAELGRTARAPEALVLLRRAHEIDPDDAALAHRLARLLHRLGQADAALAVVQGLCDRQPGGPDHVSRHLAEVAQAAGRLADAAAVLNTLAHSHSAEDRALAGSRLLRLGLEQRAQARALPDAQRPALWWMETPWPGNFGDILNPYLVEKLSGLPPRWVPKGKGLLAIGSVVKFAQAGTTVWGSGTPRMSDSLSADADYRAVRGPLTRSLVLRSGGRCPEVYGDPAWFLPKLYRPRPAAQRHRLGWIPHFTHAGAVPVGPGVRMIPILRAGYDGIEAFIDELCSCDAILTSSLHGLIVSHAYGVPARWCDVPAAAQALPGDGTKFHDYLLSVGLPVEPPLALEAGVPVGVELAATVGPLPPRGIDLRRLAEAAPFAISDAVLRSL